MFGNPLFIHRDFSHTNTLSQFLCGLLFITCLVFADNAQSDQEHWVYTVRPGDTLSSLSKRYCKNPEDWKTLETVNGISNERRLQVGSKLQFPLSLLKYQPAEAKIASFTGSVFLVKREEYVATPLTGKESLQIGDHVVTGDNSRLIIIFADGSELTVFSNSQVIMDTLSTWGSTGMVDTRIHLQGGRVETHVIPAKGPGSRYEIITPAAVAAVRGTKFRVSADKVQSLMRSEVTQGSVSVSNEYSKSAVLEGFGQLAKKGQKLTPPKTLLPATDLENNQSVHHLPPYQFNWPAIDNSVVYQIDLSSKTSINSFKVSKPELALDKLDDGKYTLNVRGIDELGLQGLNASFNFHVFNYPEAPLLSTDLENTVVRSATPQLTWSTVKNAERYELQLAANEDFDTLLIDKSIDTNTYTPSTRLNQGTYYWRVASTNANGKNSRYSDASSFRYYPKPSSPSTINTEVKPAFIDVSWSDINSAQSYELELARDREFTSILQATNTLAHHGMLDKPSEPGTYFVRSRAVNAIGEKGPYSSVQPVEVSAPDYKPFWLFIPPALLLLLL